MTITQTHNGYWLVSDIIDGYLTTRTYLNYEQKEAVEAFATEFGIDLSEEMTPCETCEIGVQTDIWLEELGFCVTCSNAYFTHEDEEANA
jgi:hypothetical protein